MTWPPARLGEDDVVSVHPYLLRYDIEISGFGSHQVPPFLITATTRGSDEVLSCFKGKIYRVGSLAQFAVAADCKRTLRL